MDCRRARGARRRRVRGLRGRDLRAVKGHEVIGRRLAGGRPVLGICVGMQVLFEHGVEHGVDTAGLRRVARGRGAAAGARRTAHGMEHRRGARRAARCSPASRRSGSTSCTPTACASGRCAPTAATRAAAGDLGDARRRPVRRRGRERPAVARPSSTPRSPATRAPRCCATGCTHWPRVDVRASPVATAGTCSRPPRRPTGRVDAGCLLGECTSLRLPAGGATPVPAADARAVPGHSSPVGISRYPPPGR